MAPFTSFDLQSNIFQDSFKINLLSFFPFFFTALKKNTALERKTYCKSKQMDKVLQIHSQVSQGKIYKIWGFFIIFIFFYLWTVQCQTV